MSQGITLAPSRQLKKRYRAEKRFKAYCIAALLLALAFLVVFFSDMIRQGYSAFVQTEIKVDVTYNEDTVKFTNESVTEDVSPLISRAIRHASQHPLSSQCLRSNSNSAGLTGV